MENEISEWVHGEIKHSARRIFKDYINYFSMEKKKIVKRYKLEEPLCESVERTLRNITGLMILDFIIKSQKEEDRAVISDYIKKNIDHFCETMTPFIYTEEDKNPEVQPFKPTIISTHERVFFHVFFQSSLVSSPLLIF